LRFLPPAALDRLAVRAVAAATLSPTARQLLDHRRDMTSTLERWLGEPLHLRVLARLRNDDELLRQVVLVGARSGRVAELGAIGIRLERFAPLVRAEILTARHPLGALLARHAIAYTSRPRSFLALSADADVARVLGPGVATGDALWGRTNLLSTPAGETLARVVEILPPGLERVPGVWGEA